MRGSPAVKWSMEDAGTAVASTDCTSVGSTSGTTRLRSVMRFCVQSRMGVTQGMLSRYRY